jgi:hypothetical protein
MGERRRRAEPERKPGNGSREQTAPRNERASARSALLQKTPAPPAVDVRRNGQGSQSSNFKRWQFITNARRCQAVPSHRVAKNA